MTETAWFVWYHMPNQPPNSSKKRVTASSESEAQQVFRQTSDRRAIIDKVVRA